MGLGVAVKGKRVYDRANLKVGESMIVNSFLPLELGGVDVILGMQWLYSWVLPKWIGGTHFRWLF